MYKNYCNHEWSTLIKQLKWTHISVNIQKLKSPADKISSFCFFIVQMLKFRSDLEETKIISLLQKADFNISIMLGTVSNDGSFSNRFDFSIEKE